MAPPTRTTGPMVAGPPATTESDTWVCEGALSRAGSAGRAIRSDPSCPLTLDTSPRVVAGDACWRCVP
jgi:hypothetical protein